MKENHRIFPLIFFCLIVPLVFYSFAFAQDFLADFIVKEKGKGSIKGKIYIKNTTIRREMIVEKENQIMIFRPDKGIIWTVIPEDKIYTEETYGSNNGIFETWSFDMKMRAKHRGEKIVSGMICEKYELTENDEKIYLWVSKDFPFPLKVQQSGSTIQYKNIRKISLSNSLFEIPSGYARIPLSIPLESIPEEKNIIK